MTTPATIDFDALLAPLNGDNPAGLDIRDDASLYYQIKDARAAARTNERQLLLEDDPEAVNTVVPEWHTVLETAPRILSEHGKDLEVAAWYTEALVREHGFAGLRDGFKLMRGIVDGYWDGVYPTPDEDGMETRVAPLVGLNGEDGEGTLIVPINKVQITEGHTYSPYATWQYEQAYELDRITDEEKKEARISAGAVTMQMINQSVIETSADFLQATVSDLKECQEEFSNLSNTLDEKMGGDFVPTSNIRNSLKRIQEVMNYIAPEAEETDQDESEEGEAQSTTAPGAKKKNSVGAINNREDAYRTMMTVAKYFRDAEPHSPVSYMLEQAVKLGRMPLPELLSQLISDDNARFDYFRLAGIAPVEEAEY